LAAAGIPRSGRGVYGLGTNSARAREPVLHFQAVNVELVQPKLELMKMLVWKLFASVIAVSLAAAPSMAAETKKKTGSRNDYTAEQR
jgi:hypothetical protein